MAFADLENKNNANIRKGLRPIVVVAPYSTTLPTALTDASGGLVALPAAWREFGWTGEDGLNWPRETEVSDIAGHGSPEPLRSDIRRSTKRLTVTALETNIVVLEQYLGMDMSTVTTALGGESTWDEPELPDYKYVRLLAIVLDQSDTGEYYMGTLYPRARVTEVGELVEADQDTPKQRQLTYTAFLDAAAGTSVRHFAGGPGRDPVAEGFPAPA